MLTIENSYLGSPLFKEMMFDETKEVMDPRDESKKEKLTLYQRWKREKKYPKFGSLGSGSDFVPFYQFLGKYYYCLSFIAYSSHFCGHVSARWGLNWNFAMVSRS
jgi:hypothetical protein